MNTNIISESNKEKISFEIKPIIVIIILLGIFLRIYQYIYNRPLWTDELFLVLNIINKSLKELLFEPLLYRQVTPQFFLIIEKSAHLIFGDSEYSMRFFPLIFGVVSIFIFNEITKIYLDKYSRTLALFLFSIIPTLIYYSSEAKQYSLEVLMTLLIVLQSIKVLKKGFTKQSIFLLSVYGVIAAWSTHIFILVFLGIATSLILNFFREKNKRDVIKLSIVLLIWGINFLLYYKTCLIKFANDSALYSFWGKGFINNPFSKEAYELILQAFAQMKFSKSLLAFLFFIIGLVYSFIKDFKNTLIISSPLISTFIASVFQVYPFTERMILFITPIFLIFISQGVRAILSTNKLVLKIWGVVLTLVLIAHPIEFSYANIKNPCLRCDIISTLNYLIQNIKKNDAIYIHNFSQYQFKYYAKRYGLNDRFEPFEDWDNKFTPNRYKNRNTYYKRKNYNDIVVGKASDYYRMDYKGVKEDFKHLIGRKRVWLIFTHYIFYDEQLVLKYLDSVGKRIASHEVFGNGFYEYENRDYERCAVYLYDLSGSKQSDKKKESKKFNLRKIFKTT